MIKWLPVVAALIVSVGLALAVLNFTGAWDVKQATANALERLPAVGPAVTTYRRGIEGTERVESELAQAKLLQQELNRRLGEQEGREKALQSQAESLAERELALKKLQAEIENERLRLQEVASKKQKSESRREQSGVEEPAAGNESAGAASGKTGGVAWTRGAIQAMKQRDAAAILATLDDASAVRLLLELEPKRAAGVMAEMEPQRSAALMKRVMGEQTDG